MGRYSPTVLPQAGGGIGAGLLAAADAFIAERDKKRVQARQDEADSRDRARFANELASSSLQRQGAQQSLAMGAVNLQNAKDEQALGPLERAARARSLGYDQTPDGGYTFNQDFAPVSPAEAFRRSLSAESRKDAFDHGEHLQTQTHEDARSAANNRTAISVAQINAGSREAVANTRASLSGGRTLKDIMHMNPEARRRHFANVAQSALQAAEEQMPPGDVVTIAGKQYNRTDARRQIAAQQIVDDPDTKDYFSYGMSTSDIDAQQQKFGERPAARADAKAANKQKIMDQLLGTQTSAQTATALGVDATAREAWAKANPPKQGETREQYKARYEATHGR